MEKMKDPAMLLSTADAIALVGVSYYFYKRLESTDAEIARISSGLAGLSNKVMELDKSLKGSDSTFTNTFVSTKKLIGDLERKLNDIPSTIPSMEDIYHLEDNIHEIVDALSQKQINVNLSSKKRSGDRFDERSSYRELDYDKRTRPDRYDRSDRYRDEWSLHRDDNRNKPLSNVLPRREQIREELENPRNKPQIKPEQQYRNEDNRRTYPEHSGSYRDIPSQGITSHQELDEFIDEVHT